jgi:hypothetical protein
MSVRPGTRGDLGRDVGLGVVLHGPDAVVHGRDAAGRGRDGVTAGSLRYWRTSLSTPRSSVAENSRRWVDGVGLVEQLLHGGQEAEVGHVVGLVEDGDLHLGQRALALLDEVLEPARGGDDEVDAAAELVDLPAHGRAAVDGHDLQVERLRERRQGVLHLLGELAGRDEDQTARGAAVALAADEAGEQRQAEGEGLARAGGAAAEDVPAGEGVRDGAGLDGERGVQLAARERRHEALGQAERGEGRGRRVGLGGSRVGGGVEGELEVGGDGRTGGREEPPLRGRPR